MAEIELGQLVLSRAGRDKGRIMIIVDINEDGYIYIADGNLRKVDNPKKKNIKHIKILNKNAKDIKQRLMKKRKITNEEVKKALQILVDEKNK